MTPDSNESVNNEPQTTAEKFDDEHYPAYSMGRAAEMLGTSANFLRSLDEAKLIEPQRSAGGHRRYSRHQLRLAARVRAMVDQGTGLDAACRIVTLEDQLQEAQALNAKLTPPSNPDEPYPPLQSV
ncbi:MerR family transcriptional regulator [Lentzea sp. HUAS TT2]|uniref:helix-turn-helix domain-containing protein n=1 Tax=Lentzea sp. HUAS TT2 TaxID=3447454 RepID=UPI003F6ECC18